MAIMGIAEDLNGREGTTSNAMEFTDYEWISHHSTITAYQRLLGLIDKGQAIL